MGDVDFLYPTLSSYFVKARRLCPLRRACIPGIETSFKFPDRDEHRRQILTMSANICHTLQPSVRNVHRINLCLSTGSLQLNTTRGATSPDTFRSPCSWPVAICSRDMLAVCYTGCWPLFPAGSAAAILSYSCMSVCGVAGRR